MTMRSLALFTHVLGMLALFVALAVEWAAVELLRTTDQARLSPFASSLLRKLPVFTAMAVNGCSFDYLSAHLSAVQRSDVLRLAWNSPSSVHSLLFGYIASPRQ